MDAAAAYRADEGGGGCGGCGVGALSCWGLVDIDGLRGASSVGAGGGIRVRGWVAGAVLDVVRSDGSLGVGAGGTRGGGAGVVALVLGGVQARARLGPGRDSAGSDARSSAAVRRVWRWRSRHCCSSSATLGRFRIRATTPERLPSPRYPGLAPRIASEVEARCQGEKVGAPQPKGGGGAARSGAEARGGEGTVETSVAGGRAKRETVTARRSSGTRVTNGVQGETTLGNADGG